MARIWAEANHRLSAEKPDVYKEIGKVEAQAAKTQARIDRYFEAFEAGTMKPELCSERIQDLNARLEELDAENRELEGRRKRLELPAIDKEMLSGLVDNFEEVMAEGTNPQKKHLLRRLVKKVLVHDRRKVEVWYGLPNADSVSRPGNLAPLPGHVSNSLPSPRARFRADADRDSSFGGLSMIRLCRWHRSTRGRVVGDRRLARTHSDGPVKPHLPHQALESCSGRRRYLLGPTAGRAARRRPSPAGAASTAAPTTRSRGPSPQRPRPSSRHHCRAGLVLGDPSNRPASVLLHWCMQKYHDEPRQYKADLKSALSPCKHV